ncbi:MAG: T9SS type A sorting domain-containing protein [Bacteroidales bacterium]|nr:T9SS type A sorting domain-containing protein [Bacteroidales bacterium]
MKPVKIIFSLTIFFLPALIGYSQSLTLSNQNGQVASNTTIIQPGTTDSVIMRTYLDITNNSANPINVLCKKTELTMLDSTKIYMCWAGVCYASTVFTSSNSQPIGPGETYTDSYGTYQQIAYNNFSIGESVVRWTFFDASNINDSVSVTVVYSTYPVNVEERKDLRAGISGIYPNPASSIARINYSIPAGVQGFIQIRDLDGASVQSQISVAGTGTAVINTLDLRDGISFCSLLVDGTIYGTKKLIVSH